MTIMKGNRTNNLMSRTFSLTKQIRSLGHQQDLWSNYLPKFSRTICSPVCHRNLFCQTNQGTRIFYSRILTWMSRTTREYDKDIRKLMYRFSATVQPVDNRLRF